ncbi:MAG: hypothetical protein P8Y23_11895, partial [Candidatus Lokiarchaeota archaeon]
SEDLSHKEIVEELYSNADNNFNRIANVSKGKEAVHIDFKSPLTKIDLVYLKKAEFDKEFKEVKDRKQIFSQQKDAIKIVKYAFDKFLNGSIRGYEVEKACIMLTCSVLNKCVFSIVNHFKGRLLEKGFTVDQFLRKVINQLYR